MGKITASLFVPARRRGEAPDQWHFLYFNDEMGAAVDTGPSSGAADTGLLSRST